MNQRCEIPKTVYTMQAGFYLNIGWAGGSLTVAIGASNTATTSWRRLFMRYVREVYLPMYRFQCSDIYGAMGGLNSAGQAFMIGRNVIPFDPTIVFLEEIWNDRTTQDKDLVRKAYEGVIRQVKSSKTCPDLVLVGVGCKPGSGDGPDGLLDHSFHRELAKHYNIPFLDMQSHVNGMLEKHGRTFEDMAFDACHPNDYGHQLWYDCLREWFDSQVKLYEVDQARHETRELPPPMVSDEFEFTKLVNPTRRNKNLTLEGNWGKNEDLTVPWYFDDILVGRPGDKLTFTFTGTAIGMFQMMYNNGLKINAKVDGEEVAGPFTHYIVEFGTFHMLKHGMEMGEHTVELEVGKPLKSKNKLEDPTARIAYLAVATGEREEKKSIARD